jgi:hypothetical protein
MRILYGAAFDEKMAAVCRLMKKWLLFAFDCQK